MLAAEDCVMTSEYLNWGGGSHSQNIDSMKQQQSPRTVWAYSQLEHQEMFAIVMSDIHTQPVLGFTHI